MPWSSSFLAKVALLAFFREKNLSLRINMPLLILQTVVIFISRNNSYTSSSTENVAGAFRILGKFPVR